MFVICSLLLLSSCDKDPLMGSEEWEQERRNNFYDYKVKNREGFDMLSITPCAYNEDTAFLTGIKNEKMWIGMFNLHTKEQLKEWNGTKTVERTIKIDKGYGEYEILDVSYFTCDLKSTEWGFVAIPKYAHRVLSGGISDPGKFETGKDILLLNGDKMIVYPLNYPAIANPCWFQESVFVSYKKSDNEDYCAILSPMGNLIMEWIATKSRKIGEPISYTEGIILHEPESGIDQWSVIRHNYQTGKDVWKTSIPSLKDIEDDARINTTILEQSNSIWKYRIDITNYDGSKKQVIFTVDVETGKVTEI